MKKCGGVSKRNRWQSGFDILMKEAFAIEQQAVSWKPPRIEQKRQTEKELEEDDREEAAAWRDIEEISRNIVRWCNFMDVLCSGSG